MSRDKQLPTLADLINHMIKVSLATMNCVSIGTVQAFDAGSQTATITMNYKRIIKDSKMAENNIDTVDEVIEYPMLVKCPVIVLNGGGAFISFPIAKGDPCVLLFSDREIDTWFRTGVVTYPQSERIHHLTDAIALIGIRSTANPLSGVDANKLKIAFGNGNITIDSNGNIVVHGGTVDIQGSTITITGSSQVSINP